LWLKGGIKMTDLNKVLLTGILCQDVELRFTPTGIKVANLRVAMHRKYRNKAQELKEETEFITVVTWDVLAENCDKYLKKGSRVFVEGRLQTREFIDKNQQKRFTTEVKADSVEFLDKPEKSTEEPKEETNG
jgi:single-strand DNA-binding protein